MPEKTPTTRSHQLDTPPHSNPDANEASVISDTSNPSERAFYFFPGCRTDSQTVKENIEPLVSPIGSTHYVNYPKEGFSLDSIRTKVLEARKNDNETPATILAHSMGGMVICQLLQDPEFRKEFGPIESIIFDSSPSSFEDVRRPIRTVLKIAHFLLHNHMMKDFLGNKLHDRTLHQPADKHDLNLTDKQKLRQQQATADTAIETAYAQAEFIKATEFSKNSLEDINADRIIYIDSNPDQPINVESGDDVIDTKRAYKGYRRAFGKKIVHLCDPNRPYDSHAASIDFPHVTSALLRDSQEDYELM